MRTRKTSTPGSRFGNSLLLINGLPNELVAVISALISSSYLTVMAHSIGQLSVVPTVFIWVVMSIIFALIGLYLSIFANKAEHEYSALTPEQRNMKAVTENIFVGKRKLRRVLTMFQPSPIKDGTQKPEIKETLVWVSHQSRARAWLFVVGISCLMGPVNFLVLWLVSSSHRVGVGMAVPSLPSPDGTSKPSGEIASGFVIPQVPYGVLMLTALVWAMLLLIIWVRWTSVYIVLTQKRLIMMVSYPKWFYWRGDKAPDMVISKIDSKEPRRTQLGKLFGGYGKLGPDTAAQDDYTLKHLSGIPRVREFAALVASLQVS